VNWLCYAVTCYEVTYDSRIKNVVWEVTWYATKYNFVSWCPAGIELDRLYIVVLFLLLLFLLLFLTSLVLCPLAYSQEIH
jgi:hypothetical protein